ncbi:GbsR/MarR family transcriptional regulator [Streptomyces oceani]|uniref:MarR family transcriptional regulator n=1 Tax=Streptomyces oceani TaxID=1075402 RepID=A0A1E7JXJ8_9ACTN|nr:MarR family transcriptional regulator [Streptomyces oceani]OEU96365.1 MarR family transcriptional regulator [Streptomyces oceani]
MGANEEKRRPGAAPSSRADTATAEDYDTRVGPFVEHLAADLTEAGMQRMAARVFACVLASEEGALSSAELAERLRCSPAAISGAVRYLSQTHMIRREREPGSRRERYRVHDDTWMEMFTQRDDFLMKWASTMRTGARQLGTDTAAGRRIHESAEFFDFLKTELTDLLERWRERQAQRDRRTEGSSASDVPGAGEGPG